MQNVGIEGFQLSPQQRRLWKLTREPGGESAYAARAVVHISGAVDTAVLSFVLDALAARHEILRTTFEAPPELTAPLQVIGPPDTPARARIAVETTGSDDHRLTIEVPALLCDARGLNNLVADIAAAYGTAIAGRAPNDQPLQYADAAGWLNDTLDSTEAEPGRRFWTTVDASPALRAVVPFALARGEATPFRPARLRVELSPETTRLAAHATASRSASPDVFFLACWQALMARLTGCEQILVGYVAGGREYPELAAAVGLFARSVPLAGEIANGRPFDEALNVIDAAVREARHWCECFDWRAVTQEAGGGVPFFPVVFESMIASTRHVAAGVIFDVEQLSASSDRFVLKLACAGDGDAVDTLWLEYDASRCSEEDVRLLSRQLEVLCGDAAAHITTPIGRLKLLAEPETQAVLALASAPAAMPIATEVIHKSFERWADLTPDAVAVACEERRLTYREVNARANQLAHHLRALGTTPDTLVGLCVDRSVDVIVGMLGILKAGGAYVPLDPQLPRVRLAQMLQQSGAAIVVSHASTASAVPGHATIVSLDRDASPLDAEPTTNPAGMALPHHLAYVLFTSGSTGTPKGVAIEHRHLSKYVEAVSRRLHIGRAASFATVTTYAADLGNTAIFPALATGGQLHIVTRERAADARALGSYLRENRVDVLKIVPSHLKALLTDADALAALPLERLVLGGEACSWDLVETVRRLAPALRIFNHYGPTETTVGAAMYEVAPDDIRPPTATVPIGRPLDHVRAYVLDDGGEVVPPWIVGELHVGGGGVARGYLGEPELTAAKFVTDPFADDPDARIYRTGDRVRMLPSGDLEFIGRTDQQIKIRGFRVEPGEVEAALARHPAVKDAVVLAHDDGHGMRLTAAIQPAEAARVNAAELKAFLEVQGLPDYMVPATYATVDAMPLTSNGKLDRTQLLAIGAASSIDDAADDPLTGWEAIVAGIWREYLQVDQIRPSDNFYDLGGHSLLAIQVVTALERRAAVQLSPRDLVFHTLKQFAALCASKSA